MSLAEGMHAPTNPGSVPRPAWTKTLPDGEDLPAAAIEAARTILWSVYRVCSRSKQPAAWPAW